MHHMKNPYRRAENTDLFSYTNDILDNIYANQALKYWGRGVEP